MTVAGGRHASHSPDGNANGYSAPTDALIAAKRIVEPDTRVSHGATFLRFARVW